MLNEKEREYVLDETQYFKEIWLVKQAAWNEREFNNIAAIKMPKSVL